MPDALFGDAFDAPDQVAPPISTDNTAPNTDHLFGDAFQDAPAPVKKSLYRRWLDETITGGIAKAIGNAVTLPGDVYSGKVQLPSQEGVPGSAPANSGEVTMKPNALGAMFMDPNSTFQAPGQGSPFGRAVDLSGVIGTGEIPALSSPVPSSVNLLNHGIGPETAKIAQTAIDKYGYPVRPGQMSDNHLVRSMDTLLGKIPGTGYKASANAQQSAVNRGVANMIGVDADKVTPETMVAARDKLKDAYKQIYGPDVNAKIDDQFSSKVLGTLDRANDTLDSPDKVRVLNKAVSNILDKVKGDGTISGPAYQGLRQTGSQLKDLQDSGGLLGQYAGDIKSHLDDLFRRTIPPDKADLLAQTDKQYAIMKQIRGLVDEGGDISPNRLMQVARSGDAGKERMAFGKGGDLGELANIAQRFKSAPSSNTAENHLLLNLLTGGGIAGTGVGAYLHDPLIMAGPLASGAVGAATSKLLGAYMKSPTRANKLISNALRETPKNSNKLLGTGIVPYLPAIEGSTPANN